MGPVLPADTAEISSAAGISPMPERKLIKFSKGCKRKCVKRGVDPGMEPRKKLRFTLETAPQTWGTVLQQCRPEHGVGLTIAKNLLNFFFERHVQIPFHLHECSCHRAMVPIRFTPACPSCGDISGSSFSAPCPVAWCGDLSGGPGGGGGDDTGATQRGDRSAGGDDAGKDFGPGGPR